MFPVYHHTILKYYYTVIPLYIVYKEWDFERTPEGPYIILNHSDVHWVFLFNSYCPHTFNFLILTHGAPFARNQISSHDTHFIIFDQALYKIELLQQEQRQQQRVKEEKNFTNC